MGGEFFFIHSFYMHLKSQVEEGEKEKKGPGTIYASAWSFNGDGGKPKGMHWKTYLRLKSHHDALVQVSFHDIGSKLGFLHKLLEA